MPFLSFNPLRNYRMFYRFFHVVKSKCLRSSFTIQHKSSRSNFRNFFKNQQNREATTSEQIIVRNNEVTITVDVKKFKFEELNVVLTGNVVIVEGLHEEKIDDQKSAFTYFMQQYLFSEEHDLNKVKSIYAKDGTLKIIAPKKSGFTPIATEKDVKIIKLGPPIVLKIERE